MKLKPIILSLSLTLTSFTSIFSQEYFVSGQDTTYFQKLKFVTSTQGDLIGMIGIDNEGDTIKYIYKLKDKFGKAKLLPEVETFYVNNTTIDKTPLDPAKPDKYVRYTERLVDGTLKVYLSTPTETQHWEKDMHGDMVTTTGHKGAYRFFIKMPDGTYYKINNKGDMKKNIIPYLEQCSEFKSQYKGDYSDDQESFKETVELYNSICK